MIPRLHEAAMNGKTEILSRYMNKFEDELTGNNNTVLHVAAQYGQISCVEQILKVQPSLLHKENCKGETPLHIAARQGNLDIVKALIDQAKDVERKGWEGDIGIVQGLIERAGRKLGIFKRKELLIRATNSDNDTAFHIAVRNGHLETVRFLTTTDKKFSHLANKAEETPLYLAVQRGDSDMVDAIVHNCISPAYGGPYGRTALHEAVIKSKMPGITSKLIRWKGELNNKQDDHGWTALHYASHGGNVSAVKELLVINYLLGHIKAGEKNDGKTALHMAAAEGNIEVMIEILSACPDCWDMIDRKGHNVLHVAAELEKENVIPFIFHYLCFGQLLYQKDDEGKMPFHSLAASKLMQLDENIHPTDVAFSQDGGNNIHIAIQHADSNPERPNWRNIVNNNRDKIAKWEGARTELEEKEKAQEEVKDEKKDEGAKKLAETFMVVASLIATVTFAAGFAIPGGYISDSGSKPGSAVLLKKAAFKAFVITNTVAVFSSTTSVFLYVTASATPEEGRRINVYARAFYFMLLAMVAMMVAFIAGTYSILSHSLGLAIATVVIGGIFLRRIMGEADRLLFRELGISLFRNPVPQLKKRFPN